MRGFFTGFCLLAALLARPAAALTIERVVSPLGIEAWLVEDHSNPILALQMSFAVGGAHDPEQQEGLSSLVAGLLDEGAGDLDSQAFQQRLDDLAISLSFASSEDNFTVALRTLSENRDDAVGMLRLALTRPRFDPDAVARVRGQLEAGLQEELQDPQSVAGRAFAALTYPGHPYGRAATPASIRSIGDSALKAWPATHLARENLVIGVVGDITPAELARLLDEGLKDLPPRTDLAAIPEITPPNPGKTQIIRRPIPQSVILFGAQGLKRDDPDWYKAYVTNYILGGGGFSSRLMTEVRVKRGLAYGVETSLSPRRRAALIEGEVATRNEKAGESIAVIKQTMRQMAQSDVAPAELASAKTYLNGAFPLQMDSTQSIAGLLVTLQREHLGIDYFDRRPSLINQVSAGDIRRIAGRLFDPDAFSFVLVGDPQGVAE